MRSPKATASRSLWVMKMMASPRATRRRISWPSSSMPLGDLRAGQRRIPLAACTGDQSAAAFAFGPPRDSVALVNVGTGAFVQRIAPTGVRLPDGLLLSVLRSDASALTTQPAADPPLFMNGVGGLGSPFWQPDFPVEFIGSGADLQLLASVVESIVFLLSVNLEAMRSAAALEPSVHSKR